MASKGALAGTKRNRKKANEPNSGLVGPAGAEHINVAIGGPAAPSPFEDVLGRWDEVSAFYTRPIRVNPWYADFLPCCIRKSNKDCRKCIGTGGFSEVFESTLKTGQKAIVKVVPESKFRLQTFREAKILQTLSQLHPEKGIAPAFYAAAYDTRARASVILMEYIRGINLASYIERPGITGAHLEQIFTDLRAKLDGLHAAGFVHHDLKPLNILVKLNEDGEYDGLVLIDFGSAQEIGKPYQPFPATRGYSVGHNLYPVGKSPNGTTVWYDEEAHASAQNAVKRIIEASRRTLKPGMFPAYYTSFIPTSGDKFLDEVISGKVLVHPEFNEHSYRQIRRRVRDTVMRVKPKAGTAKARSASSSSSSYGGGRTRRRRRRRTT
jgi:serine/threonine protein kinase